MRTSAWIGALALVSCPALAQLNEMETRWLRAAVPVLAYAKAQQLPVDIVVQPQNAPGAAPLAMGFVDGRCKLVLSMRGNPQAQGLPGTVDAALEPVLMEAMVAHEVGHCWRHAHGRWNQLPAGFVHDEASPVGWSEMRATRREEGFADLVGLAWTLRRYPAQYAAVHAWFASARDEHPVPGSHHDTRAWLRLARHASAFPGGDTPFEQAQQLWQDGLLVED